MPGIFVLMIIMLMLMFAFGAFVLWIWTLIDCIKNEPSKGNDRIMWVLVIALTNWIGALLYLIVRRPQRQTTLGR